MGKGLKEYIKEFGIGMFLVVGFTRIMRFLRMPDTILGRYSEKKHKIVERYLWKHYKYICKQKYGDLNIIDNIAARKAWVFWWQGEEEAPEVVKMCINSIRKHCELEVVCLSKKNYSKYVQIPDYIVRKAENGTMCLAHFSDVLRFVLLYEKGGIWIDSTCLLTAQIPADIFEYPFYSLNGPFRGQEGLNWLWTSFFMLGQKGNVLSKMMVDFYYEYWKKHDCAITYLFLDCWIRAMYRNFEEIKCLIDEMPSTDMKVFDLNAIMNLSYDRHKLNQVINNSYIHKISYKSKYVEMNEDNITNWKYILSKVEQGS